MAENDASFRERPSARRERRPGRRERHFLQSERFTGNPSLTSNITPLASRTELYRKTVPTSSISQPKFFGPILNSTGNILTPSQEELVEETIQCKYSEKECLRQKTHESFIQEHTVPQMTAQTLPVWLGNIDVHLDITPTDVISPFACVFGAFESYNNMPRVRIIYDESDDSGENNENVCDQFLYDDKETQKQKLNSKNCSKSLESTARSLSPMSERKQTDLAEHPISSKSTERRMSPRRVITPPGKSSRTLSPRRYQGDTRVMSMQTGGVRSTPFQPESMKFINQMITYRHMKMHKKRMKMAKPAIDTRMPKTFQMALERKYLVESRLSESYDRSYERSSPVSNDNKSTTQSRQSKH